jgi:hypothetical protein
MKKQIRRRLAGAVLVLSFAVPAAAQQPSRDWEQVATALAPGARIEVDLADGTRVEGTVLGQEHDQGRLVFSPKTRIPVAPWRIGYSEIRSLEVKSARQGMRPGTKVLLGIGIGVGVAMLVAGIAVATAY